MFHPPPTPHLPSPKQLVSCDKNNPSGATSSDVEHLSARMVSVTWQPCAMISLWAFPILQNSTASCNWFGRSVKTSRSSVISDIQNASQRSMLPLLTHSISVSGEKSKFGQGSTFLVRSGGLPQPLDYNITSEDCDTSLLNSSTLCGGFNSSPQLISL